MAFYTLQVAFYCTHLARCFSFLALAASWGRSSQFVHYSDTEEVLVHICSCMARLSGKQCGSCLERLRKSEVACYTSVVQTVVELVVLTMASSLDCGVAIGERSGQIVVVGCRCFE